MREEIQDPFAKTRNKLHRNLYPAALREFATRRLVLRNAFLFRAAMFSLPLVFFSLIQPKWAEACTAAIFILASAALLRSWFQERKLTIDYLAAARAIEAENPELRQLLLTAVEQQLDGSRNFFTLRTQDEALASPSLANWSNAGKRERILHSASHLAIIVAITGMMGLAFLKSQSKWSNNKPTGDALAAVGAISVEPGNIEIERGAAAVITARFKGALPASVSLQTIDADGTTHSFPMGQSLSDPVFAYSLRDIETSLTYRIVFGEQSSEAYSIETYDLPDLMFADAALSFPEYTNWPDRTIEDTLRISAIEGSELAYRFNVNKALRNAFLVDSSGKSIKLQKDSQSDTLYRFETRLKQSDTYTLHLEDEAGRTNPYPPKLRIDSIPNERPSLRLETPKGDQRLSAIEEVAFKGKATDDFGLLDYGIGLIIASKRQEDVSLTKESASAGNIEATLDFKLNLEDHDLQVRDSLSWFLWAVDYGPDGQPRRTESELYFADIRSFDEIFREQDQGGQGQGQGSGGEMELIEKQRRVVISLFRIKNSATNAEAAIQDLDIVQRSQVEALNQLQELIPRLEEDDAKTAASEAQRFMEGVDVGLINAIDQPSLEPLETAWIDAQSAYDQLIKLGNDEANVSRSRSQGSGAGGASRNQSQINELDFRQDDSRYETASEAQTLATPQARENLELIAKLNELSRRQDDLNERLQDLQTALSEAETEEDREEIRRELKRLEEEQREMLADADEAIQQTGNRQSASQARQQIQDARENMRRASEQLEQGEVSQALASGSRAQDTLEETREQMRQASSSQFAEGMREARTKAKQLAEQQTQLDTELETFEREYQRSLDDTEQREQLAQHIDEQAEEVNRFLEEVRSIAESSENVEPGLFRQLYQTLRDSNGVGFDERYESSSQFLRQGFLRDSIANQEGLSAELEKMSKNISQAASGILGSESAEMEFAQTELESLAQQLEQEQSSNNQTPGSTPSGSGNGEPAPNVAEQFRTAINELGQGNSGPLTGGNFGEWIERLSTVESLIEEPSVRARVSEARETAQEIRRDFKRHGETPQWELIEDKIAAPLNTVISWLESELSRINNSDTLQAIDRDPVPEEYDLISRRYYEALGNE